MTKKKDAWEAESFEELEKLTDLDTVRKALKAKESMRVSLKKCYLKRQALLKWAKENLPEEEKE
jgi:hypothetical protein